MNMMKRQRGDTIVEVLFAMAIIGITIATGYGIANRAIIIGQSAQEQTEVTKIVESQLEKLIVETSGADSNSYFTDPANTIYCIDNNLSRIVVATAADCKFGPSDSASGIGRYSVTIVRNLPPDDFLFTITGRWDNARGNNQNSVVMVYRTYDFSDSVAVASVCTDYLATNIGLPLPCVYPPTTCTDPTATNNGGPLPCVYPPTTCTDPTAKNNGGPLPCVYNSLPSGTITAVCSVSGVNVNGTVIVTYNVTDTDGDNLSLLLANGRSRNSNTGSTTLRTGTFASFTAPRQVANQSITGTVSDGIAPAQSLGSATFNCPPPDLCNAYNIGDVGPGGGRVFYRNVVRTNGWCYIESATTDQSVAVGWNCAFVGSTAFGYGFGKENTDTIVSNCASGSNPARIARSYSGGGRNDWYLPTYTELLSMYANRAIIGAGGLNKPYWSSTITTQPLGVDFTNGSGYLSTVGSSMDYVRAVRRF